jgi:hypothetical protein
MNIWGRLRAWYHRCRTCEVDSIEGSALGQFSELKPVEPLKFGHLYQCAKCAQFWFLHDHKLWVDRIPDDHLPLVRHWNQKCLTVDDSVLSILASIGGVEDFYKDYIAVPCSVQNMAGQQHEKAIVLVSR